MENFIENKNVFKQLGGMHIDEGHWLYQALQIRYVKLHFTVSFLEAADLPMNKTSALRGGMGEMLLRANCIRDRRCECCDFESECIVRRTMYSKFKTKPDYVTSGDSIGYVLECEDFRTWIPEGGRLRFQMILFGKTIVYLSQYLQAFYALGMQGLGSAYAKFRIVSIKNTKRSELLRGNDILMRDYIVHHVSDYVAYRLEKLQKGGFEGRLIFHSPVTLKYKNEFLKEFRIDAIMNAVKRRIVMLGCFEEIGGSFLDSIQLSVPEMLSQDAKNVQVRRYSSRQGAAMFLKGMKGQILLADIQKEALLLLLAGELVHIGKNTSFGFGKYQLV